MNWHGEKLKDKKIYVALLAVLLLALIGCAAKSYLDAPGQSETGDVSQDKTVVSEQASVHDAVYKAPGPGADTASPGKSESAAGTHAGGKAVDISAVAEGLSNNRRGWGLKPNSEHLQPEMPSSISDVLGRHGAYWIGSPKEKVVYLTFDEGYENGYTATILDTLKANNVKAAFFVTGYYLDSKPELVKRMVSEGHIVGNHTENHPSLPEVSDGQILVELQLVEKKYEEITGRKGMKYLRPPKGEYSERTLAITSELGYHNIFWSIALVDWVPMPGGPEEAYQSVMDRLHNGALILLHAVSKDDTEAMDRILKDVKAQGYSFKTLDQLVKN